MSTIIEPRQVFMALPVILLVWLALLAGVMRVGGAPAALVLMPPPGILAALPDDATVTARGPVSVTVAGGPGLVAALYAAGAPLVLPAGLTGCLPQSRAPTG